MFGYHHISINCCNSKWFKFVAQSLKYSWAIQRAEQTVDEEYKKC